MNYSISNNLNYRVLHTLKASALFLLSASIFPIAARAQIADEAQPPQNYVPDSVGLNLAGSDPQIWQDPDISIGSGDDKLLFERGSGETQFSSNFNIKEVPDLDNRKVQIQFPTYTKVFNWDGHTPGVYTNTEATGETFDGTIYTDRDGVKYYFYERDLTDYTEANNQISNLIYRISKIVWPDGRTLSFTWGHSYSYEDVATVTITTWYGRLDSVTNSAGYQLKFAYAKQDAGVASGPGAYYPDQYRKLVSVMAINNAVDYCNPSAANCDNLAHTWPKATYDFSDPGQLKVTLPNGSVRTNVSKIYIDNRTETVTSNNGVYTSNSSFDRHEEGVIRHYSMVFVSAVDPEYRTISNNVTVTGADGSTESYALSGSPLHLDSYTDKAGLVHSYTYDSTNGRMLTEAAGGITTQYAYDSRGNRTQSTTIPKSGSGLTNIVTQAHFPSSCSNIVTCNKPD